MKRERKQSKQQALSKQGLQFCREMKTEFREMNGFAYPSQKNREGERRGKNNTEIYDIGT